MKTNILKSLGFASLIALSFASCAETPTEAKKGCTNPDAVNYDSEASIENGGCVTIQQKQYSLFFKYTATWCGPCGDWGGPAFEQTTAANHGKILAFTIQCNDDFETASNLDMYTAFSARFPYSGTPNFQVNNVGLNTNNGGMYSEVATRNAMAPEAGIGIHYTIGAGTNSGKLNINTYVKFFQNVTGEYFAGVYILHKSIVKSQNTNAGMQADYLHHHVMMSHVTNVFGDAAASGNTKSGTVVNLKYVFPYTNIPDLDITEMEVVGIIWKKNGTTFDIVNVTPNV